MSRTKEFGQYDKETGEVVSEGFFAYVAPKRQNGFGSRWLAMAQDALDLISESNLEGQDLKVLFKLLARLDFENLLVINQSEVARALKMNRHNVNRSIKNLVDLDIILAGPRIGINRSYRLNPNFGWKGSAKNHKAAIDEERKKRMAAARITGVIDGSKSTEPEQMDIEDFLS